MSKRERFPDLEAVQVRYLRELAARIERGETTDEDDYVIEAMENALSEWKAATPEWRERVRLGSRLT